jgi:hypothetical protein
MKFVILILAPKSNLRQLRRDLLEPALDTIVWSAGHQEFEYALRILDDYGVTSRTPGMKKNGVTTTWSQDLTGYSI